MDSNKAFWNFEEFEQMHIELTNACNAACPMCVRFHQNSPLLRPDLKINQITFEKFIKYFPPSVINRCRTILFCGVHGDPCIATDTLEICEYIHNTNPKTSVLMNTNGGMRKPDWWEKLSVIFSKNPNWELTFSIDGLEDTNHIYRRNVKWPVLLANVKAYIAGGGKCNWDYLIFKHNEHQLEEAEELSIELGFTRFTPKKALGVDDGINLHQMPVLNKDGQLDYIIEPPENPGNRNLEKPLGKEARPIYLFNREEYNNLKNNPIVEQQQKERINAVYDEIKKKDYSDEENREIRCKSQTSSGGKEIFVDNFGRVMPCCYIGTHLNGVYTDIKSLQLHKAMDDYGWEHFHLDKYSLEEILEKQHLDKVFASTWNKSTIQSGRLLYCSETCGKCSSIDKIFLHNRNFKKSANRHPE